MDALPVALQYQAASVGKPAPASAFVLLKWMASEPSSKTMADQPVSELSEALDLIASIEARCEAIRRVGIGQEELGRIEALLAEIRDEISAAGRRD
jgi:hypothetical protein